MSNNIVFRCCSSCNREDNQENFSYLGDGVFGCVCGSMFTEISKIIDPDRKNEVNR